MKIIVSTRNLYLKLKKVDLSTQNIITHAIVSENLLQLCVSDNSTVDIILGKQAEAGLVDQSKCDWAGIKGFLGTTFDYPAVLEISDDIAKLTFSF